MIVYSLLGDVHHLVFHSTVIKDMPKVGMAISIPILGCVSVYPQEKRGHWSTAESHGPHDLAESVSTV